MAEILQEHGFDVAIAINGKLGLEALAQAAADLVLLDVMMPVLDGPGMLRAMRGNPALKDIPVIMMTAVVEALPADQSSYQAVLVNPPPSEEALLEQIARILGPDRTP